MAIRRLCLYGDPILKTVCKEVTDFHSEEFHNNVIDLVESLQFYEGVGLAANQIGIDKRIIIIQDKIHTHVKGKGYVDALVMVNPVIKETSGTVIYGEEGCLSVPGIFEKVKRWENIRVEYRNIAGEYEVLVVRDLEARVIQHEVDHINGKLFIEHLNTHKRVQLKDKLMNIIRSKNNDKM
jgi:peptide deformylase